MELYTSWELKGMEKGKMQGMLEGMQQGMQQGMQEGEHLAKLELARKLLAEGLVSVEKIIELTGLSREEIETPN
jgi:predicted transposase/invertase (TIGR01784 family)